MTEARSAAAEEQERRMALDALECKTTRAWTSLPLKYQTDKQFVLTALRCLGELPSKSDFERKFPQSLRFDRDVVLAFTARDDFVKLYYDRHLFVPDCLTGDKQVMLAYCSKIPRSLQECSEELCDDREVVEAAIALDGLELQYASIRLQEEKEVVIAACQKDGRALEFCPPGKVRNELTADRDFMLSVLRKHGGPMLRLVSEPLRNDRELLLEALAHDMRFRYCPFEFQTDQSFLIEAVGRRSEVYLDMNRNVQADPDVALAAICSADSTPAVHSRALEQVPELHDRRPVAMAIASRGAKEFCKEYFLKEEHAIFLGDKPIMKAAIERDSSLFTYASGDLRRDPEILMVAMHPGSAAEILNTVSNDLQREHPEITIRAITVANPRNLRLLCPYVAADLWRNRDVAIAWIRRGGPVLESFERLLTTDREMALDLAECNWMEFSKVSNAFKSDMEFMTQAVDRNGRVLRYAAPAICNDRALIVRAVANHPDALTNAISITKNELTEYINGKLELHKMFLNDFLRGIAIATPHLPPARRSQLPMLDRGAETSQAFKQLIAEFLGIPIGAELRIMRTAYTNLTDPPPRPPPSEAEAERMEIARELDGGAWIQRRLLRRRAMMRANNDGNDDGDDDFGFLDLFVAQPPAVIGRGLAGGDNNANAAAANNANAAAPFPFRAPGPGPEARAIAEARAIERDANPLMARRLAARERAQGFRLALHANRRQAAINNNADARAAPADRAPGIRAPGIHVAFGFGPDRRQAAINNNNNNDIANAARAPAWAAAPPAWAAAPPALAAPPARPAAPAAMGVARAPPAADNNNNDRPPRMFFDDDFMDDEPFRMMEILFDMEDALP